MFRLRRVYSAAKSRVFWKQTGKRALVLAAVNFIITVASALVAGLEAGKLSVLRARRRTHLFWCDLEHFLCACGK